MRSAILALLSLSTINAQQIGVDVDLDKIEEVADGLQNSTEEAMKEFEDSVEDAQEQMKPLVDDIVK